MLVSFGTRVAFGVFFKPMLSEFGWTRALTSGAASVLAFMEGLLGIVMGALNDKVGPRVVLTVCGFLLGAGYLLMSQIETAWQFYLFNGIMVGIGMSGIVVPMMSMIARWFVVRRSTMTGIVSTGYGVGALIAPTAANWLISAYDWRMSYKILGGVVLVVVVFAAQILKRNPPSMERQVYAEGGRAEQKLELETRWFSLQEAVSTRQFWLLIFMFICGGYSYSALSIHIVPYVTDLGISPATAAGILSILGGISIVGNLALGHAGDKIGNRWVFIIGFILIAAVYGMLVPAREVWMLYLLAVVFGIACGGCIASQSPLIAGLFGLRSHGLLFGVAGLGHAIGSALGPLMAGYIFDVTSSYQLAFIISVAVGIIALMLTVRITPTHSKGKN